VSVKFDATHHDAMISLGYWTSCISEFQAQNVANTFAKVFRSLVEQGDELLVCQLDTVSERDSKQILSWNQAQPATIDECIHDAIARQVLAQPGASSVCAWDANFTYKELDTLSSQLAHHLVSLGVGPEVMVPLCFEKSAWAIVAMVAVMKSGGVFVPLDASHPVNRLSEIIHDIGAKILLSSAQHHDLCQVLVDAAFVVGPATSKLPCLPGIPCTSVSGSNAAYVIFTSGTTGKPKGTVVEHAAYCTASAAHGKHLLMSQSTRVLQFASYSFDASLLDIVTTLMYGGCVCVPDEHDRLNDLATYITANQVNWASLTPSFMMTIRPSSVPGIKTLLMGGEPLSKGILSIWANRVKMFNAYGPSECSVISTISQLITTKTEASNIGTAVGGVCWVVNSHDHNQLVPIGCVGELLIEGSILARGYLKNEARTAEAFVENLSWIKEKSPVSRRFYKTGDLVRYSSDGSLNYVARKDTQVKMHGQRLELGEVEHHLMTEDSVMNALVMMPKKGLSRERLVAIIAPWDFPEASGPRGDALAPSACGRALRLVDKSQMHITSSLVAYLRTHLIGQLPAYMVPTVWMVVNTIPLSTSGKLDKKSTAQWIENMDEETYRQIVDDESGESTGPVTKIDQRIQKLLAQVLNMPEDRIALNRSFLSLGGDSITAMQVVSRGRAEGIAIKVQDVLQSKTISQLALVAKDKHASKVSREDILNTNFDLSPIQKMYFEMSGQKANHFNQSFFLQLTRQLQSHDVVCAIEAIVRQHSMLRSRFKQAEDGEWSQIITKNVSESYHFNVYDVNNQAEVMAVVTAYQSNLNISDGPLLGAALFNIEGENQRLFLVAHHLVVDLVSWRVILQDLEEILESGSLSAEKPFPFQAWCKLQADQAQVLLGPSKLLPFDVTTADYSYWGMANQPNVYGDAVSKSFNIDVETTSRLLGSCQETFGTEPIELLIATLLHAFSQTFSDRPTPTVYTEGHGREPWDEAVDLSETVGWFTTMSPLCVPVVQGANIVETIRQTKDTRRSLPDNGWAYFTSRFLNAEGVKAFGNHWPMELLFNYLGRFQQLEREGGLLIQEQLPTRTVPMDVGIDVQRLALFEVSVAVVHGVAQFGVTYNRHMELQDNVSQWMRKWENSLLEAVKELSNMEKQPTLSDFPLLSMTYAGLDKLRLERLKQVGAVSFAQIENVYPCSPMQQGMLLSQMSKSGAYKVDFMFEARTSPTGSLVDVDRLLEAWQQVTDRHAMLRTVFMDSVSEEGLFDQIVLKGFAPRTQRKHCGETEMEALDTLSGLQPMNHDDARPPHQLTVCQSTSGRIYCKLEISHAVMDAVSMSILLGEFILAYEGSLSQDPGPRYSDYIKFIQHQPLHLSKDFWKEYLSDMQPCLFPPLDDDAGEEKQLRSLDVDLQLPPGQLRAFCDALGVTVSNVLQTVWGLVLRAYTGSDQVCFGYLTSGRDVEVDGIEKAIGPFVNMLICRMDVAGSTSVAELVHRVQADSVAGLEHQHCSLADIQHDLSLPGRHLFNTSMSVQRTPPSNTASTGLSFRNMGGHDPSEVNYTFLSPNFISFYKI
jgi:amino acid adenylation domain-containing protein/non-ribosomal peptide synthase protein (TIGR01720 family)